MQPLVSITMATYNVESFIKESLDCIVNQTLIDIEIIIIDDGSTDKTPEILQCYKEKDNRIRLILKKKNEGLSVCRNKALVLAKGKYISFVDGDDLIHMELFEKAYQLAEKEDSDMVYWDHISFVTDESLITEKNIPSLFNKNDGNNKLLLLQRPSFSCVKMIKREVIDLINVLFPIGLTKQDIPVNWQLITSLNKISILPERLYYYRQQPNATSAKKDIVLFDLAYVMDITKNYLKTNNLYEIYKDEFLRQRLNLLFGMYDSVKNELKEQALNLIETRIGKEELAYIKSKKPLRKQARWFYKSITGSWTNMLIFNLWKYTRQVYRKLK